MPDEHRKRMRRWESRGSARFITFSCEHRLPLLNNPAICEIFLRSMDRARTRFEIEIFAWVLMPEHVHLLLRPKSNELASALKSLKLSVSMQVLRRWRKIDSPILAKISTNDGRPRFWQKGGGFDRSVRDETEFTKAIRYIHRNPVQRGLVKQPEDWKWSSVRWWMGLRDGEFPCDSPPGESKSWCPWEGLK